MPVERLKSEYLVVRQIRQVKLRSASRRWLVNAVDIPEQHTFDILKLWFWSTNQSPNWITDAAGEYKNLFFPRPFLSLSLLLQLLSRFFLDSSKTTFTCKLQLRLTFSSLWPCSALLSSLTTVLLVFHFPRTMIRLGGKSTAKGFKLAAVKILRMFCLRPSAEECTPRVVPRKQQPMQPDTESIRLVRMQVREALANLHIVPDYEYQHLASAWCLRTWWLMTLWP